MYSNNIYSGPRKFVEKFKIAVIGWKDLICRKENGCTQMPVEQVNCFTTNTLYISRRLIVWIFLYKEDNWEIDNREHQECDSPF